MVNGIHNRMDAKQHMCLFIVGDVQLSMSIRRFFKLKDEMPVPELPYLSNELMTSQ